MALVARLAERRAANAAGADAQAGTLDDRESFGCSAETAPDARRLIELYLPLCRDCFVVAHLGQSLDGRIATVDGSSRWVTGPEDVAHNHRMRALFDAVVVGAETVRHDDPQLTVRLVRPEPDPGRAGSRAAPQGRPPHVHRRAAPTLVLCADELAGRRPRLGQAEVIASGRGWTPASGRGARSPRPARAAARVRRRRRHHGVAFPRRGLPAPPADHDRAADHRLGPPEHLAAEDRALSESLRPTVRKFDLGRDILFECRFDG